MKELCVKRVGLFICILISSYIVASSPGQSAGSFSFTSFGMARYTILTNVYASEEFSALRQTSPLASPLALAEISSLPNNRDPANPAQQFPIRSGRQANQTSLVLIGAVLVGLVVVGTLAINRKD